MENWISLMDYAMKKGVSLSTLRRYIKSNKVKYKVESGRYLLWDDTGGGSTDSPKNSTKNSEDDKLAMKLQKAQEEIAELKMLIALYEEKLPPLRLDN